MRWTRRGSARSGASASLASAATRTSRCAARGVPDCCLHVDLLPCPDASLLVVQSAAQWYEYAAASTPEAAFRLRLLRLRLQSGDAAATAPDAVTSWVAQLNGAAAEGDAAAAFVLGEAVRDGQGVAASKEDAVGWFHHALDLATDAAGAAPEAQVGGGQIRAPEAQAVMDAAMRALSACTRDGIGAASRVSQAGAETD